MPDVVAVLDVVAALEVAAGKGWPVGSRRLQVESEASVVELVNWDVEIASAIEVAAYYKDSVAALAPFHQDLHLATNPERIVVDTENEDCTDNLVG